MCLPRVRGQAYELGPLGRGNVPVPVGGAPLPRAGTRTSVPASCQNAWKVSPAVFVLNTSNSVREGPGAPAPLPLPDASAGRADPVCSADADLSRPSCSPPLSAPPGNSVGKGGNLVGDQLLDLVEAGDGERPGKLEIRRRGPHGKTRSIPLDDGVLLLFSILRWMIASRSVNSSSRTSRPVDPRPSSNWLGVKAVAHSASSFANPKANTTSRPRSGGSTVLR